MLAGQSQNDHDGIRGGDTELSAEGRLYSEAVCRLVRSRGFVASGRPLVLTGTLVGLSRNEATSLIKAAGGKVTNSVSKKTDYLVAGDNPGSKLAQAEELGTEVLDEDGLRRLVEPGQH